MSTFITIEDYDPRWPALFEDEARRLRDALSGVALRIDHVGSTAVPGLAAKPVIDIQIVVADLVPVDGYRVPLQAIGYTDSTIPFPYFHRPSDWPHTHHVHVAGGPDEIRTLAFRDWLRTHPEDQSAYESLKRRLAMRSDSSTAEGRFRYSEAKTQFVREIERRAQSEGSSAD